jgi:hypothetical protein
MNTEIVSARIVAKVTEILKTVVSQIETSATPPTLYELRGADSGSPAPDWTGAVAGGGKWTGSRGNRTRTALCLRGPAALSRPIATAFGPDQCGDHSARPAGVLSLLYLSRHQLSP